MRFTKKELHPTVFDAVNDWQSSVMMGMSSGGDGYAGLMKTYNKHQKAWWKEYGKGFILGLLAYIAAIAMPLLLINATGNRSWAGLLGVVFVALVAHGIWAYYRNKGQITTDELKALLPDLKLSPLAQQYTEAFLDLFTNKAMDATYRHEVLAQLNTLMDEAQRLEEQKQNLAAQLGDSHLRDQLLSNIERLERMVETTHDEIAKETYASSLQIARKRMERFQGGAPVMERIEAQLELIGQTMSSFREVLGRLRSTPQLEANDLGALRQRVNDIQSQGANLESAYEELNALA